MVSDATYQDEKNLPFSCSNVAFSWNVRESRPSQADWISAIRMKHNHPNVVRANKAPLSPPQTRAFMESLPCPGRWGGVRTISLPQSSLGASGMHIFNPGLNDALSLGRTSDLECTRGLADEMRLRVSESPRWEDLRGLCRPLS